LRKKSIALIVVSQAKDTQYNNDQASDNNNCNQESYNPQDVKFAATTKTENFMDNIWISDSGACVHKCNSDRGQFNDEEINDSTTEIPAKV
jgi:uncharacterized protein YdeI (BOF family)